MSFYHFPMPKREEYDTEEEFEEAMKMWEWAEDDYCDECRDRAIEDN